VKRFGPLQFFIQCALAVIFFAHASAPLSAQTLCSTGVCVLTWQNDTYRTGDNLKEGTLTGEYKMIEGLLARLEYRRDWSNQPFFFRGSAVNGTTGLGTYKNEDTLSLGVLAFFGPKR